MEHEARRPGLVARMDCLGQRQLGFDLDQKLGRGELLRRLRRAVIENPPHDNAGGVDVQPKLDGLMFFARGLLRANFRGIDFLFVRNVGGCSAFAPARQLLMSSTHHRPFYRKSLGGGIIHF